MSALCVWVISKTIELDIQRKKEFSESTKERLAAEQTLKIPRNIENVINAIDEVSIDLGFSIPLTAKAFDDFPPAILKKLGVIQSDQDLNLVKKMR